MKKCYIKYKKYTEFGVVEKQVCATIITSNNGAFLVEFTIDNESQRRVFREEDISLTPWTIDF